MCAICKVSQWAHPVRYTRLTQRRRCPAQRLIKCIRLRFTALRLWVDCTRLLDGREFLQPFGEQIIPPKDPPTFCRPECGATVRVFVYIWKILLV